VETSQADQETGLVPSGSTFAILAVAAPLDDRTRVLKQDDTFAVFDRALDIRPGGQGELGLYHDGTRYLSRWELLVDGRRPILLSSTAPSDQPLLEADFANLEVRSAGRPVLPAGSIHLARTRLLRPGVAYESIRLRNYGLEPARIRLDLAFEADFADLFEVRGTPRSRRGEAFDPEVTEGRIRFAYLGLDQVVRRTLVECHPAPTWSDSGGFRFDELLEARSERSITLTVSCDRSDRSRVTAAPPRAPSGVEEVGPEGPEETPSISSSSGDCDEWLARSILDLEMLSGSTPLGRYPAAGLPWFAAQLGRDGIIAALECLWLRPGLAREVLRFLAATQAADFDPAREAEPGKILHESRAGEMATLGEVPFALHYGSIDATPLFVLLAARYFERTGDRALIEELWPHVVAALAWIDGPGDPDRDGFVEYRSAHPATHQAWRDSADAIFHRDGRLARGPIAPAEVQAYVYGAKREAGVLARILGHGAVADRLANEARDLRRRFDRQFWLEDLGTYALALDGDKRPCRVRSSTAGHCLFTGMARPERVGRLTRTLMSDESFSGWGVRTIGADEARYNPMSYHCGAVWPHDNALIADGLKLAGARDAAARIFGGLFEASVALDLHRLPELFAGFSRRGGEAPIRYPLACAPHAMAAAAPFLLLRASLGLIIRGAESQLVFDQPALPPFIPELDIHRLPVGQGSVDLHLERFGDEVGIHVVDQRGTVDVVTVK
jgi:glycogen debranching enzyme